MDNSTRGYTAEQDALANKIASSRNFYDIL
jgi:hypothetical protein